MGGSVGRVRSFWLAGSLAGCNSSQIRRARWSWGAANILRPGRLQIRHSSASSAHHKNCSLCPAGRRGRLLQGRCNAGCTAASKELALTMHARGRAGGR